MYTDPDPKTHFNVRPIFLLKTFKKVFFVIIVIYNTISSPQNLINARYGQTT